MFTMKLTALLVCGLALTYAAGPSGQPGNKSFSEKQQNLLRLFVNVQQPNYNQDQREIGNNFNFNTENFNNANAVKQFQNAYQQGLLPRGQVFNYNNPNQLQQAIQLFDVFYFAKDFDTFYQAASWARDRVNEGQFVYALSVAIVKRQDTQGILLPLQSEVYPNLYVNAQAIQQARNNKQQGQRQAVVRSNNTDNYVENQQQKQEQQQQQRQQQQRGDQNQYQQLFNNQYRNNQNYDNENQANQYQNQQQNNQEDRVAYFSEDINLNQQFANQQIYNPSWFNQQKYNQKNQDANRGEDLYYYLQQVLARYNLERYANNLPNVRPFQFNRNVQPGYNPQLQYHNGQAVPARPNNININNANNNYLQQLQNLDRRIADAVDSQQVLDNKGTNQALTAENGVTVLGNLVTANDNSANSQYYAANNGLYGYLDVFRKVVGSIVDPTNQYQAGPGAIETNSAALRDPVFYQVIARVVNYFQNFKNQLKPYNKEQLNYDGVEVQAVKVDELVTYWDDDEVDLYNAIYYQQGERAEDYRYKAQQQRLNNKPFNYQVLVTSQQESDAVVRVFIGPQYDAQGDRYSLEQARQNLVEIDRFVTKLQSGQNQIQRNSQQSSRFVQPPPSTRAIFSQPQQGNQTQQQQQYTLPQNLILPKGSRSGQQYVFVVAVNQYQPKQNQDQNQNQPDDNRPQGFPFDRRVQANTFQQAKNVFFQTVTVYNKNQNNNKQN